MNTDPALQELRPIGRPALISMLPGEVFASRGKQKRKTLLDPFASRNQARIL
jgi:hypothetical protein